ncbi:acetyl-CoA carboxylase carboxyltransferase subunit beta [Loigolactobacillus bifermentans]|nr:acetyl-CoA carboxylase carboxyltransferase subunit beta [Loigolactobacillus bifermentans]QGG61599.1 acetyl-CoA carboxyl transferase [Loigolactobacillus bifermentans]
MGHMPAAGTWQACPQCGEHHHRLEWAPWQICPSCGYYQRLTAQQRLTQLVDQGTFQPLPDLAMTAATTGFPDYAAKLATAQTKTGLAEAIVVGQAAIDQQVCVIGIMDSHFMMGSLNQVVGQKICQLFEVGSQRQLPVVLVTASGGARMQEGLAALTQMSLTLAAKSAFDAQGGFSINVLTDPTMGGVTASFALQADILLAEPAATIGFAGRRVIEQTDQVQLPADFQSAEQLLTRGMLDAVVPRAQLKAQLAQLLRLGGKSA